MPSAFYNQLSHEAQVLVNQAMDHLNPSYLPDKGVIGRVRNGRCYCYDRGSMYYALGLMLLGEDGCADKVEKICDAIAARQMDAPDEIYHGAFMRDAFPELQRGAFDYKRLGLYGRYYADCFYEKLADAFRLNLSDDPDLAPHAAKIEQLLNKSVLDTTPLVWTTYDPNVREFLLMCFAMLLEHFEDQLSAHCVQTIDRVCRTALVGAINRSRSNFTPLNTNIQCMHVFLVDYFGVRYNRPDYCEYALDYARRMTDKYLNFHAAAEFNSPTYCGVDLATLGFWRRYGSCEKLKELGKILEEGIWMDMMTFYNPPMTNFCGPYSRAYEPDMAFHTCFHAMFYLAAGEEKFPLHPVNFETPCDLLMVFGGVNMPEEAKEALFTPKEDQVIVRQFRELSERGDPDHNDALCTATAWITPDLMTGALAGSENPSYQLHPLVVFWRGEKGLGTIKVLRSYPNGGMQHMHTVLFSGKADKRHLTLDVDFRVNRDVLMYYEIEYPGICDSAEITDTLWKLPGLNVHMNAKAPAFTLQKSENGNSLKVCFLSEARKPATKQMSFDLTVELASHN